MSSIFRKDDNYVDKPKRNTFDLSHQNNLTLKFGELVPVLVQEVLPGDSVKIDPTFGLRFMPQQFPVQTRQRASIKYYYVRNRNLWKDWPDFIGRTKKDLVAPYLKFNRDNGNHTYYLRPSSLADYMGVPIKVDVPAGSNKLYHLSAPTAFQGKDIALVDGNPTSNSTEQPFTIFTKRNVKDVVYTVAKRLIDPSGSPSSISTDYIRLSDIYGGAQLTNNPAFPTPTVYDSDYAIGNQVTPCIALMRKEFPIAANSNNSVVTGTACYAVFRCADGTLIAKYSPGGSFTFTGGTNTFYRTFSRVMNDEGVITYPVQTQFSPLESFVGIISTTNIEKITFTTFNVSTLVNNGDNLCWCDVRADEIPFCSEDNPNGLRLSALPFRAVESIYNALIRNAENNPLIIDGVPEYNKYIESSEGGEVTWLHNILDTYHANWSDDRFTTALPSPQQGDAPLVGLTGVNGATLTLSDEGGTTSTLHLKVDSDTGNVVMVDGVSSDTPEYLNDAFMSAVEYGITINDLRNVNSFQRWLENNIRKGYKYKDQLMAHYGVHARYDVLDMPEFIGGVSRDVSVEQISQTVENEYGKLGEYGGQSYVMGQGRSIEHYCDEHGFIIGLMTIQPMPLYQDALPKYLIKHDAFDYYFPEFGKIGMQPVTNKELAFAQSVAAADMDGTFGYQRAWYDYLENLDTVRGQFRFDLRGFLIGRDFASLPKLNPDFLTVNVDDLNNTFYSDDDDDKIIGQIYHHMTAKRPIPLIGIPSLE